MRWTARILSLLPVLFYLSLWLFNEDVRARPTLQLVYLGLLTIVLLASWHWETAGGRLAVVGGLILFVLLAAGAINRGDMPPAMSLLASAAMAAPYIVCGLLFANIDRPAEPA